MAWRLRALRWLLYAAGVCLTVLLTVVVVFALQARARLADLSPWHQVSLAGEFRAGATAPKTFPEYHALEDRLFASAPQSARRPRRGRLATARPLHARLDPARLALDTPYNRSFELVPAEIRGAALLVHGLSDSPYSMRALADTLYAQGYYVLALRLPGHGTVPAGLVDVSWRDWYAAVELAARHAASQAPGKPFIAAGHSTGAALVTLYSVRALDDPSLPKPQGLYLVSAAIGISPFAGSRTCSRISRSSPGSRNRGGSTCCPSTTHTSTTLFRSTRRTRLHGDSQAARRARGRAGARPARSDAARRHVPVGRRLDRDGGRGRARAAQLSAAARPRARRVRREPLRAARGARRVGAARIARAAARGAEPAVQDHGDREPRRVDARGRRVRARRRQAGVSERDLPFEWPRGILSLGHVALPFPVDDPLYGLEGPPEGSPTRYNLGTFPARGENGALVVPLGQFARMRSNPFFGVIRATVRETLPGAATGDSSTAASP